MGLGLRNGEADLGSGGFCLRLSVAAEQGQRAPSPSPGGCESPKDTGTHVVVGAEPCVSKTIYFPGFISVIASC